MNAYKIVMAALVFGMPMVSKAMYDGFGIVPPYVEKDDLFLKPESVQTSRGILDGAEAKGHDFEDLVIDFWMDQYGRPLATEEKKSEAKREQEKWFEPVRSIAEQEVLPKFVIALALSSRLTEIQQQGGKPSQRVHVQLALDRQGAYQGSSWMQTSINSVGAQKVLASWAGELQLNEKSEGDFGWKGGDRKFKKGAPAQDAQEITVVTHFNRMALYNEDDYSKMITPIVAEKERAKRDTMTVRMAIVEARGTTPVQEPSQKNELGSLSVSEDDEEETLIKSVDDAALLIKIDGI